MNIDQLTAIADRLTTIGVLTIAVYVLWSAWAEARKELEEARKAFDRRIEELQNKHLEDIRLLAGINERIWRVQSTVEKIQGDIPRIPGGD